MWDRDCWVCGHMMPDCECGDEDYCEECGDTLDLDGWDGLCGNCADRRETERERQ